MSSYTQFLYQFVFSTKHRARVLNQENEKRLYRYIWEILQSKNCYVYRIGGVEDHIHIVTHVHQSIAIADLMRDIKAGSSKFIKDHNLFPNFKGWQVGYGGFSYKIEAKDNLIRYVKNQRVHHQKISSIEEYKALLKEHEIEWDEKYLL